MKPLANLALYRLGLLSGHYRRVSKNLSTSRMFHKSTPSWPMTIPDAEELRRILKDSVSAQLHRADDILEGKYPIFGGDLSPIDLTPPLPLSNWTDYELGKVGQELGDIKYHLGTRPLLLGCKPGAGVQPDRKRDLRREILGALRRVLPEQPSIPGTQLGLRPGVRSSHPHDLLCFEYFLPTVFRQRSQAKNGVGIPHF